MLINLKKNATVGVSIDPERGLEVTQVDFGKNEIIKYGRRTIGYDKNTNEVADLDVFKETLADLFSELDIPKETNICLSLPAACFRVNEYPAALDDEQIYNAIIEELGESAALKELDPCISYTKLPNQSVQFRRIAYCVASRPMLVEMVMQIKSLGYSVARIEPSVDTTLNSLIYCNRIDVTSNISWVLMLIESNSCKIIQMQGKDYVDCYDEKIAIGGILGEEENITTIAETVNPILKNLPSKYLYVVSKTDIISAQALTKKLVYNASIVHLEANNYATEPFLEFDKDFVNNGAKTASLDTIGAAISSDFQKYTVADLNLFNKDLGDVFLVDQPPVFKYKNFTLVMSLENMINLAVGCAAIILALTFLITLVFFKQNQIKQNELTAIEGRISSIQSFLKANEEISTELFDEGDEIKIGLAQNKNIYSYYTIVGTEIPKKLWLTHLNLSDKITIEGQADNIESIYAFYRSIKDYNPSSDIKIQKLGLAAGSKANTFASDKNVDVDTLLTSLNADFYQFKISNAEEEKQEDNAENTEDGEQTKATNSDKESDKTSNNKKANKVKPPELEPLD